MTRIGDVRVLVTDREGFAIWRNYAIYMPNGGA